MSKILQTRLAGWAFAILAAAAVGAADARENGAASLSADPYAWLEGIQDAQALDWVRAENAKTEAELVATPLFKQLEGEVRAFLESDEKIPGIVKIGDRYYNFWKDANHERGLWRRTTLEEYRKPRPKWETVIDLDALSRAENVQWVWRRADCLKPDYRRCLIVLSPGGSDADVTREFDLITRQWVKDGFHRPEAKGTMAWIDEDTVYVITDFGPGSKNKAGYSRRVKEWKRGTPMDSAATIFEGSADNAGYGISAWRDRTPGFVRDFILDNLDGLANAFYVRDRAGKPIKVDAPDSADKRVHREWLTIQLRDPWKIGGRTYQPGSLLATRLDGYMAGKRDVELLFEPGENDALSGYVWTRSHLVLNVLEDVKNKLVVLTPGAAGWERSAVAGVPTMGRLTVSAVDEDVGEAVWLTSTDFLTPNALSLLAIGQAPEKLKSNPECFDSSKAVAEQHFAVSKDGTRVPYFLIRPKALKFDGRTPTVMHGYGGFELSLTPAYMGSAGKAWLDRGGAYVIANIRGGGEYGPRWHRAALKANRHKAYEDFAAVAQDLVARKITSPKRLGIFGASNGGLLVGNMLTQYPELFGAVAAQVPLLDMQRYSRLLAGASWVAEYGDPDKPEEWAFIRTFSPYHLFDPAKAYPPLLLTTSTKDDRVHPGHARKMTAKMQAAGKRARFYENMEGGHGRAASYKQVAYETALMYVFLWEELA